VQITHAFYLGRYLVTQTQWQAVMGSNPNQFKGDLSRPVENVSWNDAQEFLQNLNRIEPSRGYRLPTEAEWEYVCRAGSITRYYFGNDARRLGEYARYEANAGGKTHPVGQKRPNAWDLYDMHGNVWEWVQDWYDIHYYKHSPSRNPRGPTAGAKRVVRGGCWLPLLEFSLQ
jgi:formylglycine-generating enzyme required for sulfatase activity